MALIRGKLIDEARKRRDNVRGESLLKVRIRIEAGGVPSLHCHKPGHKKQDCRQLNSRKAVYPAKDRKPFKSEARVFAFATGSRKTFRPNGWIVASGASSRMCGNEDFFEEMTAFSGAAFILADGNVAEVKAKGSDCKRIDLRSQGWDAEENKPVGSSTGSGVGNELLAS